MSGFAGQKILVTGGSGFLGAPVIAQLLARGARQEDITVPRSARYDLRLPAACAEVVAGQDLVLHLAANAGGIGWNRAHPGSLFFDNAAMGIHLMEEARKAGVKKFVQIGTVCAYPFQPPHIPFREDDLWAGYPERTNAPYGMAKKMMMVMGQAYRQEYDFSAIYLLPVNLYGPRDHFFEPEKSHVIPALIKKFVDARDSGAPEVIVWGSGYFKGTPVSREFLYVDDAAEAIALAAERYDGSEPVNIGVRPRGADQRPDRHGARDDRLPGKGGPRPHEARRPAPPLPRHLPRDGEVRLRRPHAVRGGAAQDDRVVRAGAAGTVIRRQEDRRERNG